MLVNASRWWAGTSPFFEATLSELLLGPGLLSMWAGGLSKSTSDGVSCLQMECGRGRGPRGMRLGSTFVLLLVDSDEPVVWLVA